MKFIPLEGALNEVKTWGRQENEAVRMELMLDGLRSLSTVDVFTASITVFDMDGTMYEGCSHCHNRIERKRNFCPYCGAKFVG